MSGHCMLTWEGILARPNTKSIAASPPIRTGVNLYEGLSKVYKIILVTSATDIEKIDHWCNLFGIHRHIQTLYHDGPSDWSEREIRIHQLRKLLGHQYTVDIAVDSNPHISAAILAQGIQTLTFTSPRYTTPGFRPDSPIGPKRLWDEIEEEVDKQEAMAASDKRIRLLNVGADLEE